MAETTNDDGISMDELDAAYAVLEAVREDLADAGMSQLAGIVNEAHYLTQLYHDNSTWTRYDVPEVGDVMYDGRCPVDVVEVTDYTAELYHIENGDGPSVAQYRENEDYDPKSPVVKVTYPNGDKQYAMPLARLDHER
jgi:hypothetical protein